MVNTFPRRYAIFEPPAGRRTVQGGLAPGRVPGPLAWLGDTRPAARPLPPQTSRDLVRSTTDPGQVEDAKKGGKLVLPQPRMPVRLITQAASVQDAGPGEPWGVACVGASSQSRYTGATACVAILDTGIDRTHPAFDGLITDANYKDFTDTGLQDRVGHGTHCAGIIFGRDQGGKRIGVAPGVVRVLIAKVADVDTTDTDQLEKALFWALDNGADIISMSVGIDFLGHAKRLKEGGVPEDAALAMALTDYRDYARFFDNLMQRVVGAGGGRNAAMVVAAAGNESHADGNPPYRIVATLPAVADEVIAVGAVGRDDQGGLFVAPFSNARPNACAPGVGILSAVPGGGLGTMTGTSQAAPHAAGVAALWWDKVRQDTSARPSPSEVKWRMLGHADRQVLGPAETEDIGAGLVRAPGANP